MSVSVVSKSYTIDEVKAFINDNIRNSLMPDEQSDINQQLQREREVGFEAVLTGNKNEKLLFPEDDTLLYLYRGQNREYKPCRPTLYRDSSQSDIDIFLWRMRLVVFEELLNTYPIVDKFFKRLNFRIDYEGLAQHYGLRTSVLDLTSNLDVALFFATCWYDSENDCYKPMDDGRVHEGILYIIDPRYSNANHPSILKEYMSGDVSPIGLQPFLRPARQKGYALHLGPNSSLMASYYKIRFTCDESQAYYRKFNDGRDLWLTDILSTKVESIKAITSFSYQVFNQAYVKYHPKGYSRTALKSELRSIGVTLAKSCPSVTFSQEEITRAIIDWNQSVACQFCDSIGRRPWFEPKEDVSSGKKLQRRSWYYYRTTEMLATEAVLRLVQNPDHPKHSEWVDYESLSDIKKKLHTKSNPSWRKIPARMINVYSSRYLIFQDYIIPFEN